MMKEIYKGRIPILRKIYYAIFIIGETFIILNIFLTKEESLPLYAKSILSGFVLFILLLQIYKIVRIQPPDLILEEIGLVFARTLLRKERVLRWDQIHIIEERKFFYIEPLLWTLSICTVFLFLRFAAINPIFILLMFIATLAGLVILIMNLREKTIEILLVTGNGYRILSIYYPEYDSLLTSLIGTSSE